MKSRSLSALVCAVVLCGFVGCSSNLPDTVPVTGTVTLDGNPIEGASVMFLSEKGVTATGVTDSAGKFTLRTTVGSQMVDGATTGNHQVAISKTSSAAQTASTEAMEEMTKQSANSATITSNVKVEYLIPARYNNPTMSQLTATVNEGGENDFTFPLASK